MPSGYPVKEEEKKYIIENKESKSYREIGKILGLCSKTIKKIAEER